MVRIINIFSISMVTLSMFFFCSSVYSQECKWINKDNDIQDLKNIQIQMNSLMEWPSSECEKYTKKMEEYKKCYCKVVSKELEVFKKHLKNLFQKRPDWQGEVICYKEGEFTSINIRLDSYELIANRCSEN